MKWMVIHIKARKKIHLLRIGHILDIFILDSSKFKLAVTFISEMGIEWSSLPVLFESLVPQTVSRPWMLDLAKELSAGLIIDHRAFCLPLWLISKNRINALSFLKPENKHLCEYVKKPIFWTTIKKIKKAIF